MRAVEFIKVILLSKTGFECWYQSFLQYILYLGLIIIKIVLTSLIFSTYSGGKDDLSQKLYSRGFSDVNDDTAATITLEGNDVNATFLHFIFAIVWGQTLFFCKIKKILNI